MSILKITQKSYDKPFKDQKPGTSGLRKKVKVFQADHYTESFIAATLKNLPTTPGTLLVGGDGRFWSQQTVQTIIKMTAAVPSISRIMVAKDTLLSTPAASHLIRSHGLLGGFLLTASHNPGGPDEDFGIKYNCENGGPAPEKLTSALYATASEQVSYEIVDEFPLVDISTTGSQEFSIEGRSRAFVVQVVDGVDDYCKYMSEIFDFGLIKTFINSQKFSILFDAMNGITGPYATKIFTEMLESPYSVVMNGTPLPDFGGIHPDPNLTYAKDLATRVWSEGVCLGAASDGDGDRNMIVAKDEVFVNPSDSVAVIAANAMLLPYFKKQGGVKGLARSMPTSAALDRVAEKLGLPIYQVPTGWKFFGNLMDAGKLSICGEESFGTGSNHIREKDGIWAVLAWLNIVAALNTEQAPGGKFIGVGDVLEAHYKTYGRNYFTRYDYEQVSSEGGAELMSHLQNLVGDESSMIGKVYKADSGESFTVAKCGDFSYTDPVDGSVSSKQGIFIVFQDGSRIVFRASGTGSTGATIRLYVEKYDAEKYLMPAKEALAGLVSIAKDVGRIKELTGRSEPTVIT